MTRQDKKNNKYKHIIFLIYMSVEVFMKKHPRFKVCPRVWYKDDYIRADCIMNNFVYRIIPGNRSESIPFGEHKNLKRIMKHGSYSKGFILVVNEDGQILRRERTDPETGRKMIKVSSPEKKKLKRLRRLRNEENSRRWREQWAEYNSIRGKARRFLNGLKDNILMRGLMSILVMLYLYKLF